LSLGFDELLPRVQRQTSAVAAVVVDAPGDADGFLFVAVDAFDGSRQKWGPCPWLPSNSLPQVGDAVLVVFDEQQTPWVMTQAAVTSSGWLDGGRPDSVYGMEGVDGGGV
jgi:hypothetical protein